MPLWCALPMYCHYAYVYTQADSVAAFDRLNAAH